MVGYIVSFAAGAGTGIALVLAHRRGVERAVQAERDKSGREIDRISREKSQMQQRYENQLRDRESRISYQRGMEVGKREGLNASNGERLEHALRGEAGKRSVQIGSANAGGRSAATTRGEDSGFAAPQPRSRGPVADWDGADTERRAVQ